MTPLSIGLVGPLPPPSGGMANQTLQLAALLRSEGIEVTTVQVNAPYQPAWIGRIKGLRAVARLLPYLACLWRTAGSVQVFHVMANSGWSWHLFAAPAIWIARLRGTPVVVNYRGGEADDFLARAHRWIAPSLERADAVIVPSGFLEAVFGKYGLATQVVPNIVNLDRFSSAAEAQSGAGLRLLVARNLEPIYDNASALRALALVRERHPDATLVVAGSGPQREQLERLAAELGITQAVTFTGRVDNAAMAALYQNTDVMLNPSLVDNMPNSVLESLACGVPVVSTNVGGVPYLVEDGRTALLVPPQAPEAMAAAVLRLAAEPALAASLREAGLRQVQSYTWASVRPRLLAVYQNVRAARARTTALSQS
ncbi:glycosyltransferase family 4 protein [Pseudoduganella umbonata]|uniref:Glycosyltransferase family 4 protein n=1 Tax=Pseudoduganella umbonata TaxID=864828 RepID=A0A4P8HU20_9BURK|nr:glycosyltransferase family 4 protein [Pseudoduganella umbonata]MBB3223804.1 glycosyltransferase involved in cell wall biosynthesis [Pseudoduganella umbonata]QCP12776.1 glycosyltransferase family 4 protein [Pseudoduganella umbonata]